MTEEGEQTELDDLLVDRNEINKKRLAGALDGIIGVDQDSGELLTFNSFQDLNTQRRITAVLLGYRAAHELGVRDESDIGVNSERLSDIVGTASGTIRSYASQKLPFVESAPENGGYHIPQHSITDAISFLEEGTQ